MEVKRNVYNSDADKIIHDFEKLDKLTLGVYSEEYKRNVISGKYAPYQLGVFIFMGGTFADLKCKLQESAQRVCTLSENLGERNKRIFCVCSVDGKMLEYTTFDVFQQNDGRIQTEICHLNKSNHSRFC